MLRSTGLTSLDQIAKTRGLSSIADLIRANVDYLTYHVTMKLRRIERNPGVFDVIDVVMEHTSIDFLPSLKDIVDDVLQQTNSKWQKNNVYDFLKVFYTFAVCIRRLTANEHKEVKESDEKKNLVENVVSSLLEYVEAKKVTENLEDELLDEVPDEQEIQEGMEKYSEFSWK